MISVNTNRQLIPTQEHPRLLGDSLGVHLLIINYKIVPFFLKFIRVFNFSYFSKCYVMALRKTISTKHPIT